MVVLKFRKKNLNTTVGCGRFPATPPPTTTTAETPTTDSGVNTLHLPCTEAEENATACRYGGECFVLEIGGIRSAQCKCPRGYLPPRCNELDPNVFWNDYQRPDRVASAGIAASVVAVVLFVTVLVCIVIWRRRYLRKKNSKPTQNGKNGSLMNDQMPSNVSSAELKLEFGGYSERVEVGICME
ncbi:hypothetical protein KUTeg_003618 [Tegillarca granosa]|uniref:EGF-like domain-containing protein n=1 Tax=Tegillarca granosa TaxID=220873 RepID=A0ABQ9FPH1_TEGGR|nr:hypothetical protein KUTeg_003618 [Tegillarca granosa]